MFCHHILLIIWLDVRYCEIETFQSYFHKMSPGNLRKYGSLSISENKGISKGNTWLWTPDKATNLAWYKSLLSLGCEHYESAYNLQTKFWKLSLILWEKASFWSNTWIPSLYWPFSLINNGLEVLTASVLILNLSWTL